MIKMSNDSKDLEIVVKCGFPFGLPRVEVYEPKRKLCIGFFTGYNPESDSFTDGWKSIKASEIPYADQLKQKFRELALKNS